MTYFDKKLGPLTNGKPMLFASYAKVSNTESQGGTLPNQIFIHWDRDDLDEKIANNNFVFNTLWFFAHEVAHLFQRGEIPLYENENESWLHEGHADYLAAKSLRYLYPETKSFVSDRLLKFENHCADGLQNLTLEEAAKKERFDLYYTCGLLIHKAIDEALKSTSSLDTFLIWKNYRRQATTSKIVGADVFLNMVEQHSTSDFVSKIQFLIKNKVSLSELRELLMTESTLQP